MSKQPSFKLQEFISFLQGINGYTVQRVFVLGETIQAPLADTVDFYRSHNPHNEHTEFWSFEAKVNDCNNATSVVTFSVLEKTSDLLIELDSEDNPYSCLEDTPRATAKVLTALRIYVREFMTNHYHGKHL